ncbi:MAG: polysaccharide biosynthesis/export family protein [Gammaproteobacteria bacterium]
MRTNSVKVVVAAALLSLGAAGCSLPGMSFHGAHAPASETSGKANRYSVQRITPDLLTRQARTRQNEVTAQPNPNLKQAIANYAYQVQPQDVLQVTVWGHPEFSASGSALQALAVSGGQSGNIGMTDTQAQPPGESGFTVQSDGTIYFPYVGNIQVGGLTTGEIRSKLAKALSSYVRNPQVSVTVSGFNSQTYQLSGAVSKPGLYPITNVPRTVSEAIQSAGGILQTVPTVSISSRSSAMPLADLAHVLYIHNGKRHVLNLRAFFLDGDESQDQLLHSGDIIQVPDNSFDQVHLIGEIQQPGNYPLDNGRLNLAQALGDAGGLNLTTANPSRIFVFRGAYQKPEIFWLDARSPEAMLLATQFQLKPQDVVYIATAGVSTWNRIVTQILPTVQALYETKVLVNP